MRVKLLTLRFSPGLSGLDDRPLDDFIRDKEVLSVREHFFRVQDVPHLACLVTYREGGRLASPEPPAAIAGKPRKRPDPLTELEDEERPLFETLREWRSAQARKDGVPPYILFTNRELVSIVRTRPQTPSALQALPGIGAGKVERYGAAVLARIRLDDDAPATEET
jgi:superfamily II DNA helicase RecQ